jgi:hypothetical protein
MGRRGDSSMGWARTWAIDLAVAGAVGLFLGLVGPFGTYFNGPPWQRVLYWLVSVWGGALVFSPISRWTVRRPWPWPRRIATLVVGVLAAAIPFSLANRWYAFTVWPDLAGLHAISWPLWYLEVLLMTAPQVAAFAGLAELRARAARAPPAEPRPAPGLLGAPAGEVLCLQMEDHYVRVHTAAGSRLVLATMGQAMAALGGAAGLQTHRSWWVADRAVSGAVADGRNLRLTLSNGLSVPVARSAVAAVRAAGWLER